MYNMHGTEVHAWYTGTRIDPPIYGNQGEPRDGAVSWTYSLYLCMAHTLPHLIANHTQPSDWLGIIIISHATYGLGTSYQRYTALEHSTTLISGPFLKRGGKNKGAAEAAARRSSGHGKSRPRGSGADHQW